MEGLIYQITDITARMPVCKNPETRRLIPSPGRKGSFFLLAADAELRCDFSPESKMTSSGMACWDSRAAKHQNPEDIEQS